LEKILMNFALQKVAHRGGSALAPENTLAAFRHALALSADAIELDVQMSRDGHAIVFHDETVERLTDGRGNVLDLDLAALQALNAAAHFAGGWLQPERIPTLREALDLAHAGGINVYIEIKPSKRDDVYGRYPGIAEAVTREVLAADMLEQVLIMSFDWEVLPQVKMLAPGAQTGALVSDDVWNPRSANALSELVKRVKPLQCEWINLDYDLFTPEMPEFFHANGYQLGIWTVNDEAGLQRLARAGVDSLTTDRPDLFHTFL
jgi:glycerophosphoryl diester phosphodiesterase